MDMVTQRVLLCMGTRPEIIRMAPVYRALKDTPLEPLVLHTGQDWDLARTLYDFFRIQPDYCINLRRKRASMGHLSALLLDELDEVFDQECLSAVLVHGDTTPALAAALAAFYQQIPVGHVEAGLRSVHAHNLFPEEQNRALIARLARWHFSPTPRATHNLLLEGIPQRRVHFVGNTVVDAARWSLDVLSSGGGPAAPHDRDGRRLLFVAAHRRENRGPSLHEIAKAVRRLAARHADVHVVWSLGSDPSVRPLVENTLNSLDADVRERICLVDMLDYPKTLNLLSQAWLLLTDSGSLQEKAAALNLPVLVLRTTTERPELIEAGGGVLVGTEQDLIVGLVGRLMSDRTGYDAMVRTENPFGDGRAAGRIAAVLQRELPKKHAFISYAA
jgi:UDP-N-acetylglucosamine 2-epimerase